MGLLFQVVSIVAARLQHQNANWHCREVVVWRLCNIGHRRWKITVMQWTSAKIQENIFLYWKSHKILLIINQVILQYISHRNIYFPVVIIALFQLLKPFKLVVTQRWQWDLTLYNVTKDSCYYGYMVMKRYHLFNRQT